jgi:DNA repair ATPase RecN
VERQQLARQLAEARQLIHDLETEAVRLRSASGLGQAGAPAQPARSAWDAERSALQAQLAASRSAAEEAQAAAEGQVSAARAVQEQLLSSVKIRDERVAEFEERCNKLEAYARKAKEAYDLMREQLTQHQRLAELRQRADRDTASREEALLTSALWEVGRDIQRQLLRQAVAPAGGVALASDASRAGGAAASASSGSPAAPRGSWLQQERLFAAARRTPVLAGSRV